MSAINDSASSSVQKRHVPFSWRIGVVVLYALILLSALLAAHWCGERTRILDGATAGYSLRGTYQNPKVPDGSCFSAAFMNDGVATDEGEWQLVFYDAEAQRQWVSEGTYQATIDPNVYTLLDEEGQEVGSAHLAYATQEGTTGRIYITYGGETYSLPKISSQPAIYADFSW